MNIKEKLQGLIKNGFLYILSGNILNRAIAMISAILVAALVNKQEYAYLGYADNLYGYLSYTMGLGLSSALLKYCSVAESKSVERAYFRFSVSVGSVFEIIVSLGLCVAVSFINIPFPNSRKYCWMLILYPVIHNFYTNILCYFRTQLNNKKYALAGIINSGSSCILTIILLKLFGTNGIVASRYTAITIAVLYCLPTLIRYFKNTERVTVSAENKRAFLSMGIALMLANLFSSIMPLNEAFLVNNIIKDEIATSNFKVAGQFPQLLLLVSGAITVYFFPIIAKLKDGREIKKKVIQIEMLNIVLIVFLTLCGIIFTPFVFHILYGTKYDDAVSIARLLWIMRAVNCSFRMVPINMLPAIGKTKFNVVVAVLSCAVQVALDYYFLTNMGITGVAYGAIIVFGLSAVAYWIYFIRSCNEMSGEKE